MNKFNLMYFSGNFGLLYSAEQRMHTACELSGPGTSVPPNEEDLIREVLAKLRDMCWESKLRASQNHISQVEGQLRDRKQPISAEALKVLIYGVRNTVINELVSREFLWIDPKHSSYIDTEELLGKDVMESFPSAIQDIKDAGNCLATECNTAAVFHLMRCSEWGLREMARRLKVRIKHKGKACPIEYGDWETVITGIKNKIAATRQLPTGPKRSARLEFYSDAADHCTFMKDIYRNNVSHTRKPYKPVEAQAVFERVRDFMQFLARFLEAK